jgi:hypothetical protein
MAGQPQPRLGRGGEPRMLCPEHNKRPGVAYAFSERGVELPVVDITNPAFALDIDERQLPAFTRQQVEAMEKWSRVPGFVRAWFARNSVLMGSGKGGVLDGMSTYLYKLGPENLGSGYTKRMDARVAANIMAVAVRLRFREVVRILAEDLSAKAARTQGTIAMLNLAGGTAMDSIDALIVARNQSPDSLAGRRIRIHVLDPDAGAFVFATNALAVLTEEATAPLQGVDVGLVHHRYDWDDPSTLSAALGEIVRGEEGVTVVASSEGGLFEYGSEDEIVRNLELLRDALPEDVSLAGSALKNGPITRLMKKMNGTSFVPRTLDELSAIVARAGWGVAQAGETNPVYHVFALGRA